MRTSSTDSGLAVAAALLALAAGGALAQDTAEELGCLGSECHAIRTAFQKSPHSALDTRGVAASIGARLSCEACHGELVRRDKKPGEPGCDFSTFAFDDDDSPAAKTARCLTCHYSDFPRFDRSPHGESGMDCTTCHEIHGSNRGRWPLQRYRQSSPSELKSEIPSAPCHECHDDVFAEFQLSERHRLPEGILQCTSCHDPHEPQSRWSLGGFKQEACSGCHASHGGPFVYEHEAVRVEGCTACHVAHGSPNRHLLHFQSVADLCYSCHAAVPAFHSRFTADTACTNCHSSIHGSNLDPFFLR